MDLLHLVWENNSDTPLNAQNLSKSINHYSEENEILFIDENDSKLKFRANTKITIPIPQTAAFFQFDDSLASHDSKFYPTTSENASLRIENTGSLGVESATTNLVLNPDFTTGLTSWTSEVTGSSTIVASSTEGVQALDSARIIIDGSGNQATLSQIITLSPTDVDPVSVSFYYKSTDTLKVSIVADMNYVPQYWRSVGATPQWESIEANALVSLPAVSTWTRVEIPNIAITSLSDKRIKIKIFSDAAGSTHYIDQAQLEFKNFCSSFTDSTRGDPRLIYSPSILRMEEGLIDVKFIPKYLDTSNIICAAWASGTMALSLLLNKSGSDAEIIFKIWDTDTSAYIQTSISLGEATAIINQSTRVIATWNDSTGINLYVNSYTSVNVTSFVPYANTLLTEFYIGGDFSSPTPSNIAESVFNGLKVNLFSSSTTDIETMLESDVNSDNNLYDNFENLNNNIIISGHTSPDTAYYVWVCKITGTDTAELLLSTSQTNPAGYYNGFCKLVGGFITDGSSNVVATSLWDITDNFIKLTPESLLIISSDREIKITMTASEIQSAVGVWFNNSLHVSPTLYAGALTSNASYAQIDNIRLDGNTVSATTGALTISASGAITIDSGSATLGIDTDGTINITGGTGINISSSSSTVNIEQLKVGSATLEANTSYSLTLKSASATDVILEANSNKVRIATGSKLYFDNNTSTSQMVNLYNETYGIGVQSNTTYIRSAKYFAFHAGGTHDSTACNPGTSGKLLAMITDGTAPGVTVNSTSCFYAGRVYNAVYKDIAECWKIDTETIIDYGMVVVHDDLGVRPSIRRAQKGTVGIVSKSFGYLLGGEGYVEDLKKSTQAPIAIAGRVTIHINESLEVGDEIVSAPEGKATKANWFEKIFLRDRIVGAIDDVLSNNEYLVRVR